MPCPPTFPRFPLLEMRPLNLAIASGKGGTGKTTVATNLAYSAEGQVCLLDCDVEEPNAHIFMRPEISSREAVSVPVPQVNESLCTACGKCGEICRFSAIVAFKTKPLVFTELCHGCGGCALVCPVGAISEVPREIGCIERGSAGRVEFVHGRLNVGEAMSPPLIRAVKKRLRRDSLNIIDAPPGTSCPAIEAVRGVDYVVLVTEPTPFGLNDLKLAVETVRELGLAHGVVINRAGLGDARVNEYCLAEGVAVLAEIPDDRRIAEAYSRGQCIVDVLPEFRGTFSHILDRVQTAACP